MCHRSRSVRARAWLGRHVGLVLAFAALAAAARSQPHDGLIPLAADRFLYPPTLIACGPHQELVALVTEGEPRTLALYRADSLGGMWWRWTPLPAPAPPVTGEIDLAISDSSVIAAGAVGQRIWIASLPLSSSSPTGSDVRMCDLETKSTVLSLVLDAAPAAPDSLARAHLAYLLRGTCDSTHVIEYRHSADHGLQWSLPETLAIGRLGPPAIFARSRFPTVVDLCYPRDGFMRWRVSGDSGREWAPERAIRLGVGSSYRSGVARAGGEVLAICENDLHQVAGATSRNGGSNWEPAIAIARRSDHLRLPSLDYGGGLFWVGFSQGDSLVVLRSAKRTWHPKRWSPSRVVARSCGQGAPGVVALPDSSAGVLFATLEGQVYFMRVRQEKVPAAPDSTSK